jgi:hypothetical protein
VVSDEAEASSRKQEATFESTTLNEAGWTSKGWAKKMNDIYTDDELNMMDGTDMEPHGRSTALAQVPPPIPLYPIPGQSAMGTDNGIAPNGAATPQAGFVGFMKKPVGPLPLWAWLLIGGGVAGTGYFALRKGSDVEKNKSGSSKPSIGEAIARAWSPSSDSDSSSSGGWEPSRSRFAEQLQRYFDKKGQSAHVVVWHDADEAKKGGMKFVSPLVNVQIKGGAVKPDAALTRFCRREGLDPKAHSDGNIGFYPHSSKRGKEWEEYIDALRDDGQSV